jgi:putative tryptophan/tyrosine transport system substrate-binding protein
VKRREFIALVGGAATWPLGVRAQQPQGLRLVGVVTGFSDAEMRRPMMAFREKLHALGWSEGSNVRIDLRTTDGDYKRMAEEARTLIAETVDVIVTTGTPGLVAVRQHTQTLPVVFALVADPIRQGLIESLARPGGHATGFTNFEFPIGGKWLELLWETYPYIDHVTLLANPANPIAIPFSQFIEAAGRTVALDVSTALVRNPAEIEAEIGAAAQRPSGAIIVLPDGLAAVHSALIIGLVSRHRLLALYPFRLFTEKGGLMSYGLDIPDLFRQVAVYVDRVLKGEKPGELPVQAPNKFELVINLKTARALGLNIPPSLLARADEVIE